MLVTLQQTPKLLKQKDSSISLFNYEDFVIENVHPLEPYSVQSISAAEAVSLAIGHNPGRVATPTQDTRMAQSSQQAGTHFADLRRQGLSLHAHSFSDTFQLHSCFHTAKGSFICTLVFTC